MFLLHHRIFRREGRCSSRRSCSLFLLVKNNLAKKQVIFTLTIFVKRNVTSNKNFRSKEQSKYRRTLTEFTNQAHHSNFVEWTIKIIQNGKHPVYKSSFMNVLAGVLPLRETLNFKREI